MILMVSMVTTMGLIAKVVTAAMGAVAALAEGVEIVTEVLLQQMNVKDKPIALEEL
jgi:hypothetical protein